MERQPHLTFTPIDHPDPQVHRAGFDLDHPYVERCWAAVVGPSATLLLRRVAGMWVDEVPARIDAVELSQSLGLGESASARSRLRHTLDRLVRFGLARNAPDGQGLDVHRSVAPLSPRQLARVPEWTRRTHDQLLDAHLAQLSSSAPTQPSTVSSITTRLDRLQHTPSSNGTPGQALGR